MLPHIGDVCYAMSMLNSYRKKNNISNLTILIKESNYALCSLYNETFDDVVYLTENQLLQLRYSMYLLKWFGGTNRFSRFVNTSPHLFDSRLYNAQFINAGAVTKEIIYGLDSSAIPAAPCVPRIDNKFFEQFTSIDKKIIISPYANTVNCFEDVFWVDLVDQLIKRGYEVYSNVAPNQHEIKGSKRLDCSIVDLLAWASEADYFVGIRSGIFDLIAYTKCKKICMYYEFNCSNFYDLEFWGCTENLVQLYGPTTVNEVLNYIN